MSEEKIVFHDEILIIDDAFPDDYCEKLRAEFDRLEKMGVGGNRTAEAPSFMKDDHSIAMDVLGTHGSDTERFDLTAFNLRLYDLETKTSFETVFFRGLQKAYDIYTERFSVLKNQGAISAKSMKAQKTYPGGGYHVWHYEQGPDDQSSRILVYSLYLNTVPEENQGGTQFLYRKKNVQPVENRLVIWPASFTHTHRGNVLLGENPKYIVTGWFHYVG